MRNAVGLFVLIFCHSLLWAQNEERYQKLVRLPDTLSFVDIDDGWSDHKEESGFHTQRFQVEELRAMDLIDSLPGHQLYLYADYDEDKKEAVRAFLLTYENAGNARGTWFFTELEGGKFQYLESVADGDDPVVELRYVDIAEEGEGSTEFEMSVFLGHGNYPVPMARVIRKIWETKHGSYNPACRDYRFSSIEFSREIYMSGSKLHFRKGRYKHSSNMECEVSNGSEEIPGGVYEMVSGNFIRKN